MEKIKLNTEKFDSHMKGWECGYIKGYEAGTNQEKKRMITLIENKRKSLSIVKSVDFAKKEILKAILKAIRLDYKRPSYQEIKDLRRVIYKINSQMDKK